MGQRGYERTHPWISFKPDFRGASPALWVLLGEAASKIEHIAGTPLKPSVAQDLHQLFLAKGAMATTAIEGNTLSEEQVRLAVEGLLELPKSQAYLKQEVANIIEECNRLLPLMDEGSLTDLTYERLLEMNAQVLKGLSLAPEVVPGQIRTHSVGVGRYRGAPHEDCEFLLRRLCEWLPTVPRSMGEDPDWKVPLAIFQAVLAHLYLAWIHPFGDGNGRTARLVEFELLIQAGVPSPAAHLLSNHYNHTRAEYYRQLDQASQSGGDVIPFVMYAVQGFVDGLREQIKTIRSFQMTLAWNDYVHSAFQDAPSKTAVRRQLLVQAMGPEWIKLDELLENSGRLAQHFNGKTPKTLTRDINALVEMDLVEKSGTKVRARFEIIEAFLPRRSGKRGARNR